MRCICYGCCYYDYWFGVYLFIVRLPVLVGGLLSHLFWDVSCLFWLVIVVFVLIVLIVVVIGSLDVVCVK